MNLSHFPQKIYIYCDFKYGKSAVQLEENSSNNIHYTSDNQLDRN